MEKTRVNPENFHDSDIKQDNVFPYGILGRFFGPFPHSPFNIVGFVLAILLGWVILYSFLFAYFQPAQTADSGMLTPVKLVELVFPLIAAMVGFLFGQQHKSDD